MDIRHQIQDSLSIELRQPATGPVLDVDQSLQKIESIGVLIPNKEEVINYLERHSNMIDVTEGVIETTAARFPDGKFSLEVFCAYRNNQSDEYLTLYVWKAA